MATYTDEEQAFRAYLFRRHGPVPLPVPKPEGDWPILPGWHSETEWCEGRCGDYEKHRFWIRECARCGWRWYGFSPEYGPFLCRIIDCERDRNGEIA